MTFFVKKKAKNDVKPLRNHTLLTNEQQSSRINDIKISYKLLYYHRDVAQFGRALRSGRRGRVFESRHPDQTQSEMAVLFNL